MTANESPLSHDPERPASKEDRHGRAGLGRREAKITRPQPSTLGEESPRDGVTRQGGEAQGPSIDGPSSGFDEGREQRPPSDGLSKTKTSNDEAQLHHGRGRAGSPLRVVPPEENHHPASAFDGAFGDDLGGKTARRKYHPSKFEIDGGGDERGSERRLDQQMDRLAGGGLGPQEGRDQEEAIHDQRRFVRRESIWSAAWMTLEFIS